MIDHKLAAAKFIEEAQSHLISPARCPIKLRPGEVAPPPWPLLDGEPPEGYRWETDSEFAARLRRMSRDSGY